MSQSLISFISLCCKHLGGLVLQKNKPKYVADEASAGKRPHSEEVL